MVQVTNVQSLLRRIVRSACRPRLAIAKRYGSAPHLYRKTARKCCFSSGARCRARSLQLQYTFQIFSLLRIRKYMKGFRSLHRMCIGTSLPRHAKIPCRGFFMCAVQGSNLRPFACHANALPAELTARSQNVPDFSDKSIFDTQNSPR